MKSKLSILAGLVGLAALTTTSQAVVIAGWDFQTPFADTTAATSPTVSASTGTGTAVGVHASAATAWSTPSGNGSTDSMSSNTWAIGDYYQFTASTVGYEDIIFAFAQTSSTTGPGEFKIAYQVNGGGFTDFLNYTVLPNSATLPGLGAWGATEITGYNFSVDLSAVTALDNTTTVDFRLIMRTTNDATPPGTVAAGGTSRVDNVSISGTAIPETTITILAGLGLLGFLRRRR